jgi:glycosyltransferase involved in cell wall biosynthesis
MQLSIVICVFESWKVTQRQVKYFNKMHLPNDIEFVIVDDGSKPPHKNSDYHLENLKLVHTNDFRKWTQGIARNFGVKHATGEYILCTDIDHILSKEAIMASYAFRGTKMIFPRYLAVLDKEGRLTQDTATLIRYGLDPARLETKRGLYASYHGNTYCMPRELYWTLGGNPEWCSMFGHHAPSRKGEDSVLARRYNHWALENNAKAEVGPPIYMFTNGRYNRTGDSNPMGLFHTLSYAQPK